MVNYGRKICQGLEPGVKDWAAQAEDVYYDGERVYYQIAEYTGDPTWKYCAGLAEKIYRDGYVIPNGGKVAGFNNFTRGITLDHLLTGDSVSKDTVLAMAQYAAFAVDGTPLEWTADIGSSREVAYVIMAYLNAERLGAPRRARLADMVNQALGHMDQWFVSKTAPYMRPFMVALTSLALIDYYEVTKDPRVPPMIKAAADGMWAQAWIADQKTFQYTNIDTSTLPVGSIGYNTGGKEPSPDLNLLIAPVYGWVYLHTGDTLYRDRGDEVFEGGVVNADRWLYLGKQFDQNYLWSASYVKYREQAQPSVTSTTESTSGSSTTTVTPTPTSTTTTTTTTDTSTTPTKTKPGKRRGQQ